jgi:iron complex outermembrane receptor protein
LATTLRNYSQFYIPGYDQAISSNGLTVYTPATMMGVNTGYVGGLKGEDKGFEVQATVPLGRIVHALTGFGLVGGISYNDGSLSDGTRIPGLSKYVYQATAFYENGGFSARVSGNKRSAWLSEDRGGSNTLTPVDRAAETLVDAQVSFDFKHTGMTALKGLKVSLQAQNLTNQQDTYTDTVSGLVLRNEQFGRNFMLNATYSFF